MKSPINSQRQLYTVQERAWCGLRSRSRQNSCNSEIWAKAPTSWKPVPKCKGTHRKKLAPGSLTVFCCD